MIRIHDLSIPPLPESERRVLLEKKIRRFAGGILPSWKIARRSVDARKKEEIRYIYTVDLEEMGEKKEAALLKRARGFKAEQIKIEDYRLPEAGQEVLAESRLSGQAVCLSPGQTYSSEKAVRGHFPMGNWQPAFVIPKDASGKCCVFLRTAGQILRFATMPSPISGLTA